MDTSDSNHYQQKIFTKSFINISLTHFVVFISFYSLMTTLPMYAINNLGRSQSEGGLLVTAMLIAAILMRPFSGKILELAGKRKTIIIGSAVYAVTMFGYLATESYGGLMLLRFLHGLSFGVITTAAGAIAADLVPLKRRGEGLGYFTLAMNLAVVLGPFLGLTLMQTIPYHTFLLFISFTTVAAFLCACFVNVQEDRSKIQPDWHIHTADLYEKRALGVSAVSALTSFAYASIISYISIYAAELGLSAASSYFFIVFAIVLLVFRPFVGRQLDVKGPRSVILPCLYAFAIGLLLLTVTTSSWMLLLAAAFIGLGYGSVLPCFQTVAVQRSANHRSGHATATFFVFIDSGIALGSAVLGVISAQFGFSILYLFCALLVLLATFIFTKFRSLLRLSAPSSKQQVSPGK